MHWILVALCLIAVLGELAARSIGLGKPLLYERTPYGYRVKPSQNIRRFGNRLYYNRYGMRSEEIAPVPRPNVLRILCVGDSVTYGGVQTTQGETYPYLLEAELTGRGIDAEVLNASAGGWAPENEEGWLRANGTFGSKVVVIQWSTHDLFQRKAPSEKVGSHPQFPAEPPLFALQEAAIRYVFPRLFARFVARRPNHRARPSSRDDVAHNLRVLASMVDLVRTSGGQPVVLYVDQPEPAEVAGEIAREATTHLLQTLETHAVPLIRFTNHEHSTATEALFRDPDHPTPKGNRVLANLIADNILSLGLPTKRDQ